MKLYVVNLPIVRTYAEIRDTAKKVDPYCIITKVDERKFEFQSKVGADEVARVFDGVTEIIEYDVKKLMK